METEKGFSTPDEEIIKEAKKYNNVEDAVKKALSLKEQEVSKTVDYWENELKKCEKFWTEKYQTASDNWKHWYDENKKNKECLSSLQEKIEDWIKRNKTSWEYLKKHGFPEAKEYGDCIFLNYKLSFPESLSAEEELQKIIKEMGE